MYLRLALSIALFTNNEIILLDEVISVGDAEFRLKAIQKIRDQANKGRACIMVSHDLNTIAQLCDKCLLLEKGSVLFSGAAGQAVQEYYESIHRRVSTGRTRPEHEVCEVLEVKFDKENYYTDEPVTLSVKYRVKVKGDIRIIVKIGLLQNPVMTDSVAYRHNFEPILYEPGVYETQCTIPQNILNRGNYLADIIVGSEFDVFIDFPLAARFTIQVEEWEANKNWNTTGVTYPLRPHLHWETKRLPDYDQ
jgi:lipopolysaccharide transport system ATP-binding protein